jgi:hypothetical protein
MEFNKTVPSSEIGFSIAYGTPGIWLTPFLLNASTTNTTYFTTTPLEFRTIGITDSVNGSWISFIYKSSSTNSNQGFGF